MTTNEIETPKITNLDEGRRYVEDFDKQIRVIVSTMQGVTDNAYFQELSDRKYDLRKAKRAVQSQMAQIVRSRYSR